MVAVGAFQRSRSSRPEARPCVYIIVVCFWYGVPNAHIGKVACRQVAYLTSSCISGIDQIGAWSWLRNVFGLDVSPRSAGFSTANSVPASAAALRMVHVRRTSSFADLSSRLLSRHAHTCGHLWTLPRLIVIQGRVPKFVSSAGNYLGGAFLGSHHSGGSGHGPLTPYRSPEQAKKWLRKCLQLSAGKPVDTCGHSRG